MDQLRAKGIPEDRICMVGDVMYDSVLYFGAHVQDVSLVSDSVEEKNYV